MTIDLAIVLLLLAAAVGMFVIEQSRMGGADQRHADAGGDGTDLVVLNLPMEMDDVLPALREALQAPATLAVVAGLMVAGRFRGLRAHRHVVGADGTRHRRAAGAVAVAAALTNLGVRP